MDRPGWSYISGRVTVLSDKLMDERALLGLYDAADPEERRSRLRASLLYEDVIPGEHPADEIEDRFAATTTQIGAMAPNPRIARPFLLAGEWTAFRRFAKETLLKRAGRAAAHEEEESDARAPIYRDLLRGEAPAPEWARFAQAGASMAAQAKHPEDPAGAMDLAADAAEAASILDAVRDCESEQLTDCVHAWLTLSAATAILRARRNNWDAAAFHKEWYAAGFDNPALRSLALDDEASWPAALIQLGLGESCAQVTGKPLSELAGSVNDWISASLRDLTAGIPFGPERVFAFLWALRNEATNLRTLLLAADAGMERDRVGSELHTTA